MKTKARGLKKAFAVIMALAVVLSYSMVPTFADNTNNSIANTNLEENAASKGIDFANTRAEEVKKEGVAPDAAESQRDGTNSNTPDPDLQKEDEVVQTPEDSKDEKRGSETLIAKNSPQPGGMRRGPTVDIDTPDVDTIYDEYYDCKLITTYIDIDTGKEIRGADTQYGDNGKDYKTEKKEITDYEFVKDSGNTTGTFTYGTIKVTYYYKKVIPETPTKNVYVTMKWSGDEQKDRPDSINVKLLRDGKEIDNKTTTADQDWSIVFEGLAAKDDNGNDINYLVEGVKVDGYKSQVTEIEDPSNNQRFIITNTKELETPAVTTVDVSGKKTWAGNNEYEATDEPDRNQSEGEQTQSEGEQTQDPEKKSDSIKTGDSTAIGLFIALLLVSLTALVYISWRRKYNN